MKHTLFTLLAALVASPAFADNLLDDVNNWTPICDESHNHLNDLENGNFVAKGDVTAPQDACTLLYTSTAYKMENGSSLAITLQFDTRLGSSSAFAFILQDSTTPLHVAQVDTDTSGAIDLLCLASNETYTLWYRGATSATLTFNYIVEDDNLCYTYKFNDDPESEKITVAEGITEENLSWQPVFWWLENNNTDYKVTNVTFSMVPEPTTATLSLLALAGLAARRRRK